MLKKGNIVILLSILVLGLAACVPAVRANSTNNPSAQNNGGANPVGQSGNTRGNFNSLDTRLAPGTLLLEGTNQAVTQAEAKQLLPLWQQVQTMMADSSTTPQQLQAVYQQIQAAMTSDQIQAIQNMSLNGTEIQNLMAQYGIQVTPGAGGFATLTPDQRATRTAQRATQAASGSGGSTGARPNFSGTPGPNGFGFRGMDRLLLTPLIDLLQQRAGS